MGARQSKRSVDITAAPKKDQIPTESGTVQAEKADVEKIIPINESSEVENTVQNGKIDSEEAQPTACNIADKKTESIEEPASPAQKDEASTENLQSPTSQTTTPNPTEKEKKPKKKFSLRSLSFGKKDKSKSVVNKTADSTEGEPEQKNVGNVESEAKVPETIPQIAEKAQTVSETTEQVASPQEQSETVTPKPLEVERTSEVSEESHPEKETQNQSKELEQNTVTPTAEIMTVEAPPQNVEIVQKIKEEHNEAINQKEEPAAQPEIEETNASHNVEDKTPDVVEEHMPHTPDSNANDDKIIDLDRVTVEVKEEKEEQTLSECKTEKSPNNSISSATIKPVEIIPPVTGPAITEDVTSVNMVIEDTEIADKALVSAVNGDLNNSCEIITDSINQLNIKE